MRVTATQKEAMREVVEVTTARISVASKERRRPRRLIGEGMVGVESRDLVVGGGWEDFSVPKERRAGGEGGGVGAVCSSSPRTAVEEAPP